jgi:hypothetical protein
MSSPAEMAERQGRMLAELAELGLELARDLQGRALAAEGPAEAAALADAFHRIARSVRQSLALEARLQRDAARDAREQREEAARAAAARRDARKAQLAKRVERLIWDEAERAEDAFALVRQARDHVEAEAETETFLDEPVEAQIARIRAAMEAAWAEDETPDDGTPDEETPNAAEAAAGEHANLRPATPRPPWPSPHDDWANSA